MTKEIPTKFLTKKDLAQFNKNCARFKEIESIIKGLKTEKDDLTKILKEYKEDATSSLYIQSNKFIITLSKSNDKIKEELDVNVLEAQQDEEDVKKAIALLRSKKILKTSITKGTWALRSVQPIKQV